MHQSDHTVIQTITRQGILPLYFHAQQDICIAILQTLYQQGIRTVEFTNRGPEALANFKALAALKQISMPDILLGVGTIKNGKEAEAFIAAGADYLISPGFSSDTAAVARQHNRVYIPGCATATELMTAEEAGCSFVKIFPGNILGTAFLDAVRDLFPGLQFMPTGGVTIDYENMASWFKAGVKAVGLGSKLINRTDMDNRDYDRIATLTQQALNIVNTIRNPL